MKSVWSFDFSGDGGGISSPESPSSQITGRQNTPAACWWIIQVCSALGLDSWHSSDSRGVFEPLLETWKHLQTDGTHRWRPSSLTPAGRSRTSGRPQAGCLGPLVFISCTWATQPEDIINNESEHWYAAELMNRCCLTDGRMWSKDDETAANQTSPFAGWLKLLKHQTKVNICRAECKKMTYMIMYLYITCTCTFFS